MIDHTLSYGRQYITDEDIQAVVEALKSDYLTQGPKINKFEKAFAEFCDSKYAKQRLLNSRHSFLVIL